MNAPVLQDGERGLSERPSKPQALHERFGGGAGARLSKPETAHECSRSVSAHRQVDFALDGGNDAA